MFNFRLEREKQELQDFLERDNKAMRDRMSKEEEERQRKEREMQVSKSAGILIFSGSGFSLSFSNFRKK